MKTASSLPSLCAMVAALSLLGAGCFGQNQEQLSDMPQNPSSGESMMVDEGAQMNPDADMMDSTSTATSTSDMMATSSASAMDSMESSRSMEGAAYGPFTRRDYDRAIAAHDPVLLFFYSADSNESKTQEFINVAVFQDLMLNMPTLRTQGFRVNIGDNQTDGEEADLAKAFHVTKELSFIFIDGNGKEITRKMGAIPTDELRNLLKEVANR